MYIKVFYRLGILAMFLLAMSSLSIAVASEATIDAGEAIQLDSDSNVSVDDIAKFVIDDVLIEVPVTSSDVNFSGISPVSAYSFEDLAPGQCVFNNEKYMIMQGDDALAVHITWAEMSAQLQVGLINENWTTIYAVPMTGGSATTIISTEGIPSGGYYVAVLNDSNNALNVFGAISYSWQK